MEVVSFRATTLPDAWFQLVYALVKGETPRNVYVIDKGSYVGQRRLEFPFVVCQIDRPGDRPLIPEFPETMNIPAPVESMDYVNDYVAKYLLGTALETNETYIYGTWLAPGVERVIDQLRGAPGNNQAAISIGGWAPQVQGTAPGEVIGCINTDDIIDPATGERDPACMRQVDFRLEADGTLHMFVYFRSWDLWGGFPANLAGLQTVKEYVCQQIDAKDGRIVCASKGLHIYDHALQVAAARLGMADVDTFDDLLAWIDAR